jgi:hypothetical protein
MERTPYDSKNPEKNLDFVLRNAFGNPLVFDSAQTNSTMKANTWGVNGTDIYIKFGNDTTIKLTGVSV